MATAKPTPKVNKATQARKNAEAEKARKKALRDTKAKTAMPAAKPGQKGRSLVPQSKTRKSK